METELYDWQGDRIEFEEYADKHLRKNRNVVHATDMDYTMFDCDLGVLVFLEKLEDPHFWDFDNTAFERLVLPGPYYGALSQGARGEHGENLPPQLCQLALDLHKDIVHLYGIIQKIVKSESSSQDQTLAVREFARKMVELDRIFLEADRYLSKLFNGDLLMRTRFFAGKELGAVHHLTEKVMKRKSTDVYRVLDLEIPQQGRWGAIDEERINEVYGVESPRRQIDRYVPVVDNVRFFIRESLKRSKAIGLVITANLQGIGNTAVRKSPYDFFKRQRVHGKHVSGAVIGSRLIKNGSTLGPRMEDKPVFGDRKAFKALEFAQEKGRKLGCAIGDSPSTDGPMMRASLIEGGTAILVGHNLEEMERRFAPALDVEGLQEKFRDQIYYILAA